jgi:hypothetical protein
LLGDEEMVSMDWILKESGLWKASMVHNFGRGLDRQDYFMGKGRGY